MALTPKRQSFAMAYVETGNASEAYRRAFDAENMKPETIKKRASELLANGDVKGTVAELQAKHAEEHGVTVETIAEMLKEDRKFARQCETPAAAVSATMGLAKLYGHLTDKVDAKVSNGQLPAAVNVDDVA